MRVCSEPGLYLSAAFAKQAEDLPTLKMMRNI